MAKIVVIGSANQDIVYSVEHIPAPGETVRSDGMMRNAGGKGANQAVAAGKAGGDVAFIGAVGHDEAGLALRASLANAGVNTAALWETDAPTGSAFICVAASGENSIVVHAGANELVSAALIADSMAFIEQAKVCIMQLEIPLATVWHTIHVCAGQGILTILNPSPAVPIPEDVLALTDILVPNEHEAEFLLGQAPDAAALKAYCLRTGVKRIIMTMGSHGVWNVTSESARFFPCKKAKAVDTTGAGDCFLGALAAHISNGHGMDEAIRFAMAASAIKVTRQGAQQGMPALEEINAGLR